MQQYISIAQIVVSVALIVLILLQQRDSDVSGFLGGGGGSGGGFYQQRRGLERMFFVLTVILVVVFAGLAFTSLLYTPSATPATTPEQAATSTVPVTVNTSNNAPITITPGTTTPTK